MKLSPDARAEFNHHVAELLRITKAPRWPAWQLRININEHVPRSVDYKIHEPLETEA
jgi:hypothetical protein